VTGKKLDESEGCQEISIECIRPPNGAESEEANNNVTGWPMTIAERKKGAAEATGGTATGTDCILVDLQQLRIFVVNMQALSQGAKSVLSRRLNESRCYHVYFFDS
jgi:hypothetical protein